MTFWQYAGAIILTVSLGVWLVRKPWWWVLILVSILLLLGSMGYAQISKSLYETSNNQPNPGDLRMESCLSGRCRSEKAV